MTIPLKLQGLMSTVTRGKQINNNLSSTPLQRCLSTVDLTLIGIGCMLGSGVYILTGEVAGEMAGPAGTISFLLAGIVALLSALCYMECATRLPETGASYLYAYVSFGEIWAFLIGWNAIILRAFSVALISRGWSSYFDDMVGDKVSNFTVEVLMNGKEWDLPILSAYPDFVGAIISLFACILVAIGTEASARANAFFVSINLLTILTMFTVGLTAANFDNLTKPAGYFPRGFSGVITGAAACFTGYCGFEAVAFSAEEARNPARGLPIAIMCGFVVSMGAYIGAVFVLTSISPFDTINPVSPFVTAFEMTGMTWMKYLIGIGALCSMTGGLVNCAFCLSRAIYVMARDGLLPSVLGKTNIKTQTPVQATVLGAFISVLISLLIDFVKLIQLLSLVAFLEFVIVTSSCIVLRYTPPFMKYEEIKGNNYTRATKRVREKQKSNLKSCCKSEKNGNKADQKTPLLANGYHKGCKRIRFEEPNVNSVYVMQDVTIWTKVKQHSARTATICVVMVLLFSFLTASFLTYGGGIFGDGNWVAATGTVMSGVMALIFTGPLFFLPKYTDRIPFKVPLMPVLPLFSLVCDVILMVRFDLMTWSEFAVWTLFGLFTYFAYGLSHSNEARRGDQIICSDLISTDPEETSSETEQHNGRPNHDEMDTEEELNYASWIDDDGEASV